MCQALFPPLAGNPLPPTKIGGFEGFAGFRPYASLVVTFEDVGAALAKLRKKRGISQEELAARLNLSGSTSVSSIETGNPRADTIARYLRAIDCTPHDLADALAALSYSASGPATGAEVREVAEDELDSKVEQFKQALDDVVLAIREKHAKR